MVKRELLVALSLVLAVTACVTPSEQAVEAAKSEIVVAAAQPTESAGEQQVAEVAEVTEVTEVDKDRVICRRTIVTGSRFSKNICKPWRDWKMIEDGTRDAMERMQRKSIQTDSPQGG